MTSISVQAQFAKQRVENLEDLGESKQSSTRAQIFCADAADPSSWNFELQSFLPPAPAQGTGENWLLALNTLHHFSPSRLPLFKYTRSTLRASLTAFDLRLSTLKSSSRRASSCVFLCLFTGTPSTNFLSDEGHTALLVEAGYDASDISFRNVAIEVFAGITGYINSREEVLKGYGGFYCRC
ncbi:hypothetical protein BDW66DRAFT_149549 [Aspergillus desertorum]